MKPPKLQRWIDLLAALLRHHFPVSFEQLVREVPAYGVDQSDDALPLGCAAQHAILPQFQVFFQTGVGAEADGFKRSGDC
jgi:hypothetical protein